MKLNKTSQKILTDILSIPTAPLSEHKVISYVTRFCLRHGFGMKQDKGGNIFIKYKHGKARQPVVISAHMDHPGFEVLSSKGLMAEVGILGGVRLDYFSKAKVKISSGDKLIKGKVIGKTKKKWMGKPVFRVKVSKEVKAGDFGYYDLPNVQIKKDKIYTKAADNLAGTALLLDLLLKLKKKKAVANLTVLLTRTEELGFIGSIFVADNKSLSKKIPIIVLETSDYVAGKVGINEGMVIRVGDKQSGFTPEVDSWMHMVAENLSEKKKLFKFQRALLAGGRCEASGYMLKGYTVGATAFPLGNYHNNGLRGPAPEFIGIDDYNNMLEFFLALVLAPKFTVGFEAKEKELWDNFKKWKPRFLP